MLMMMQRCLNFARIVARRWTEVTAMRLINADTAAAFAENCGATFVAKRLRDSNAFPEVVTRCWECKYSCEDGTGRTCEGYWNELSEFAVSVKDNDFCSHGKPKDG